VAVLTATTVDTVPKLRMIHGVMESLYVWRRRLGLIALVLFR
jgi:hypothetical protein